MHGKSVVRHTVGDDAYAPSLAIDGPDLEVSIAYLAQDLVSDHCIGQGATQSRILHFQILQPLDLIQLQTTVFSALTKVGLLGDTQLLADLGDRARPCFGSQ